MLLCATLLLAQAGQAQVEPRPPWTSALPDLPGRIYAVGMADLGTSEAEARMKASDRARLEVVSRLRATVKGETAVLTQTQENRGGGASVGSGQRSTREWVQVGARAEDLPGLVVERFHVDGAARAVYALAYLDQGQAQAALSGRLEAARGARLRLGEEASRKARWRLRGLQGDVVRLEELSGLLNAAGLLGDFSVQLQAERLCLEQRLAKLESAPLPPLDLASTTIALRANTDLPGGVQDYLEARIRAQGPACRSAGADFILEITFGGTSRQPEFISSEMTFAAGVLYHLDARLRVLDAGGGALTRTAVIGLVQGGSPEGLVEQFRKQFDRRLPKLLDELMVELK